jgi:hypothetical protein
MTKCAIIKTKVIIRQGDLFLEGSIKDILNNGACYDTVYSINRVFELKSINDVAHHIHRTLKFNFPAVAYAKKSGFLFKLTIEMNENGHFITIESVDDVKFFDREKGIVDLAFYVRLCVELCERFVIYELKST